MPCKLVVNSFATYGRHLSTLLQNLEESGVEMTNVVVAIGGCRADAAPSLRRVRDLCDGGSDASVVVVRLADNAHDFNGVRALCKYMRHELLQAPAYVYIHDTCACNAGVAAAMVSFAAIDEHTVCAPPTPAANICVFGRGVLRRMRDADAYSSVQSKHDAFLVEHGRHARERGIPHYGRSVRLAARRPCGVAPGAGRMSFYYPDLGVHKFVTRTALKATPQPGANVSEEDDLPPD